MLLCCCPQIAFAEQMVAGFVVVEDDRALPADYSVFEIDIAADSVQIDQVVPAAHVQLDRKIAYFAVEGDTGVVGPGLESELGAEKIEVLLMEHPLHEGCYQKMQ